MAGHAGKAFWFSKASGEFVTSDYYYERYPGWVNDWNARKPASAYAEGSWALLHPRVWTAVETCALLVSSAGNRQRGW